MDKTRPMYSPAHGADFPSELYIFNKTGKTVNGIYYNSGVNWNKKVFEYLTKSNAKLVFQRRNYQTLKTFSINDIYEIDMGNGDLALISFNNRDLEDMPAFLTKGNQEKSSLRCWIQCSCDIEKFFNQFPDFNTFAKNDNTGKIHLLKATSYGFETEAFDLKKPKIDLELNYGTGFTKIHRNIVDTIRGKNDNNAKLVLLHGLPGTGKTTYLKYLAHELGKKVLFLPPVMADGIVNPDFVPFLMENKDCVLIVEDAEKVIGDRQSSGSSIGVSNLLNLSDGILGDILNIHIIATFNMDREKIDSALLRKGRLIAEHKFGKLSVNDTNKLLEKIGKETTSDKELTLAEIYNIDNQQDKTKEERQTIGFNRY